MAGRTLSKLIMPVGIPLSSYRRTCAIGISVLLKIIVSQHAFAFAGTSCSCVLRKCRRGGPSAWYSGSSVLSWNT